MTNIDAHLSGKRKIPEAMYHKSDLKFCRLAPMAKKTESYHQGAC